MKKVLLGVLVMLFSASCVRWYDYKYISLEQVQGIRVVSRGRPDRSSIQADKEMPLRYELNRDRYVLLFELDENRYWSSIFIGARSMSGVVFAVEPLPVAACGRFDKSLSNQTVKYVWIPAAFVADCPVQENEGYVSHQVIRFSVKDREGKTLGEEHVPFVLVRNGSYYLVDGL